MLEAYALRPASVDLDVPRPVIDFDTIPAERVVEELELNGMPRPLLNSVKESLWGKINSGKMIIEVRNAAVAMSGGGSVNIYDFDDCLMSATNWHKREYDLVARDERLQAQGVNITPEEAKQVYEMSKINIPGVAEKEKRYTPRLNLVLLSVLADIKKEANRQGVDEVQTMEAIQAWSESIHGQVHDLGEGALKAYRVNPIIQSLFRSNPPSEFLYSDFVYDELAKTGKNDTRIIATRGKIEGPLGQVYKVHSSGLMRHRSQRGQGIDMVVYSNDVKAEALLALMKFVPDMDTREVRILDDNPSEVVPYLKVAQRLGAGNIEVIQVGHPDAKRKDLKVGAQPSMGYVRRGVLLRKFTLLSVQHTTENPHQIEAQ